MTCKPIVSSFALAVCVALSACSATPQPGGDEAQLLAYPAPVAIDQPPDAPDLDGAPHVDFSRADCDIHISRTGQGVAITPVAMLDRPISGEYDLVLSKDGPSGASDVTQGGPFNGRTGETVKLGRTELSLGRRDHYRVVLTLTNRGRAICRREVRN
jgi:hypothetical protein